MLLQAERYLPTLWPVAPLQLCPSGRLTTAYSPDIVTQIRLSIVVKAVIRRLHNTQPPPPSTRPSLFPHTTMSSRSLLHLASPPLLFFTSDPSALRATAEMEGLIMR